MDNLNELNHLPAIVVQGRHDVICPPFTAYRLVEAWGRQAQLRMVDDAGILLSIGDCRAPDARA